MSATGSPPHADDIVHPAELLARGDVIGLLRACHDRRLEREGIPMVLGIADERSPMPVAGTERQLAEGAALAEVFDRYSAALVPWAREDDEDAVITAMQVLGYTHFAPDARPLAAPAPAFDAESTVTPQRVSANGPEVAR